VSDGGFHINQRISFLDFGFQQAALSAVTLDRGAGFFFRPAHHSLNSPDCSCVAITLPLYRNANHSIMWAVVKLDVADCVAYCVGLTVPQSAEWQGVAD